LADNAAAIIFLTLISVLHHLEITDLFVLSSLNRLCLI